MLKNFLKNSRSNVGLNKYKIIFSNPAVEDLEEIDFYIRNVLLEPEIANNLITRLMKSIDSLAYIPNRIKTVNGSTNIRKLISNDYLIFFTIKEDKIIILDIVKANRDLTNLQF